MENRRIPIGQFHVKSTVSSNALYVALIVTLVVLLPMIGYYLYRQMIRWVNHLTEEEMQDVVQVCGYFSVVPVFGQRINHQTRNIEYFLVGFHHADPGTLRRDFAHTLE